jgi:ankyrin repeat protein
VYWVVSGVAGFRPNNLALIRAARSGDLDAARGALAWGADPNANGFLSYGVPMHAAVSRGHVPMVRYLVARGARVDKPVGEWHRQAPLGHAVHNGDEAMVRALLDLGADPYQKGCCYGMPEPLATALEKPRLLKLLVRRAGRLDRRADRALLQAVDTNNPAAVRILLAGGANPNAREERHGVSALEKAVGFPGARVLLLRAGAKPVPKKKRPATGASASR